MTDKSLAIIGGGASATLLLAQLARGPSPLTIDVYDRAGTFARGIAYSTAHRCHLLNVRASNMSALADAPDDFVGWVARHGYSLDDFVPRALYGDYLHEHFERARQALAVSLIQAEASSIQTDEGYLVNDKRYDLVVQATGNCKPLRPAGPQALAGFHDNPWTVDYAALSAHERIAILGSGLTAVDAVLALDAHGYQGRIVMLSRHALLPGVHVKAAPHPAFMHELPQTALAALHRVRREINAADAPWQAVIDTLRPITNAIWQGWRQRERRRFMRYLLTVWNIHRHRMPPQIGEIIAALEQSGHLVRHRARIGGILPGPLVVTDQGEIKADAVINCLGYRPDSSLLAASHQIGPARSGELLETTAIPEIRMQAAELAVTLTRT